MTLTDQTSNSNFAKALKASFTIPEEHPQYNVWLDYALKTNERGKAVVNTIGSFIPNMSGKKHLDIGCGYGGTCISFAEAGCLSTGIDTDAGLLCLAESNLSDHPHLNVNLLHLNAMDWEGMSSLGKFDIITCDNVIEHVEIPERLIAHCQKLLNPKGIVYLTIPNAFSFGQIQRDCHYGQFGISLLDPLDAAIYVSKAINQPSYDVSDYFPYSYYEDLFIKYGFRPKMLNNFGDPEAQIPDILRLADELQGEATTRSQILSAPEEVRGKIIYHLRKHIQRLKTDIQFYEQLTEPGGRNQFAVRIVRDYKTELWYLILRTKRDRPGVYHKLKSKISRLLMLRAL